MPSKIAIALADVVVYQQSPQAHWPEVEKAATLIDDRLTAIRKHYEPEELARCPIVSHHPDPCVGCLCAAMRAFILIA